MRTVTAREANHGLSELLSAVESGEEIVITRHGRPVAVLRAYQPPAMSDARRAAIDHALAVMEKGLAPGWARRFTRDEMNDRSS
jgi:prevent-host-death family protein